MDAFTELDRLTGELCDASTSEHLDPALELLAHRESLLRNLSPNQALDLQPMLRRGEEAIAKIRDRRDQLAHEIGRLRQSRERLDSFRPARTQWRRIDLKM